ncbi:5-oxoprolinase subunit C family protein [Algoriphagus namhaensis]
MIKDIGSIKVLRTGPGTKVRDLGRMGFSEIGVPEAGPGDEYAFRWNNLNLQNNPQAAQLEISQPGFEIKFSEPTWISFAGAFAKIYLNEKPTSNQGPKAVQAGDILKVGTFTEGALLYLAIRGGFQSELVLGSRSMFLGITEQNQLAKGSEINYFTNLPDLNPDQNARITFDSAYLGQTRIDLFPGPEWSLLDSAAQEQLREAEFTVSSLKNSMAVQFSELVPNSCSEILTAPVFPGTIQLTPGGKLICLLQDAQVSGGYPRIGQVKEWDLKILVQKIPGSIIRWSLLPEFGS